MLETDLSTFWPAQQTCLAEDAVPRDVAQGHVGVGAVRDPQLGDKVDLSKLVWCESLSPSDTQPRRCQY